MTIKTVDIGDRCTHCGEDTSPGSGRFVNRIPSGANIITASDWADTTEYKNWIALGYIDYDNLNGYACAECMGDIWVCVGCGDGIALDEDYGDDDDRWHFYCIPDEATLRELMLVTMNVTPEEYSDSEWENDLTRWKTERAHRLTWEQSQKQEN